MAQEPIERSGPYENAVGEALYQTRILAVSELARRIDMDRRYVSEMVNGWRLPSAEQLDAMCAVLGWTPEQLYPTDEFRAAIEATRKTAEPASS